MNNEISIKLTTIAVFGSAFSSIFWWVYAFTAFLFGYTVTFLEPNKIIASVELLWGLISGIILFKLLKNELLRKDVK